MRGAHDIESTKKLTQVRRNLLMHVKLLVLIIALCFVVDLAQAQRGARARKLTTAEIEKVVQMVSADNAKMQIYCEISKLNEQIGSGKSDRFYNRRNA